MYLEKRQQVLYKNQFFFCIILFLIAGISALVVATTDCSAVQIPQQQVIDSRTGLEQSTSPVLPTSLGALPLSFESNQGQTAAQNEFLVRGPGYTLFLSAEQAVFRLKSGSPQDMEPIDSPSIHSEQKVERPDHILQIEIVNANPDASVESLEQLPGKVNYFTGNDPANWHTNIPTHARVRYNEVYPGIDLEYYGRQGQLEYDFVVAPGSDPEQIRLAFKGVDSMEIAENGDLLLHTSHGALRQKAPFSYQEKDGSRQIVPSQFVYLTSLDNSDPDGFDRIGFKLAAYDASQPLVIDPALSYASYLGGTMYDYGKGVTTDSSGNIYVIGTTESSDFPTVDPYQATSNGSIDSFISKISPDGSTLLYSTFLGGSGADWVYDIAVDSSGTAYVIGETTSTDFPVIAGTIQETAGGSYDVFVAKLSPAGNALGYATYLGGINRDHAGGIAVTGLGNAFITGYTQSTDFPTTGNALYPVFQGGNDDAFVSQLNTTGTALVYSTYLGGISHDRGDDIAIDTSGNAYVTGHSYGDFPVTQGSYDQPGSLYDIFVSKVNTDGSTLVYSTLFGGNSYDYPNGIALDSFNRVYITGKTSSIDFPVLGAYQTDSGGDDAFLVQLEDDGSALLYSSYLGGEGSDVAYAIAVDSLGTAYIAGSTASTDFPVKQAYLQGSTYGGGSVDAFVSRFDLSQVGENSLRYSLFLGGVDYELGIAITSPAPDMCYVVGNTRSVDFPLANPRQDSLGAMDAFLVKISDDQAYADISVTTEVLPDTVEIESDFSYQVHVVNNGLEPATGVLLTYTLPVEVDYLSSNATRGTLEYSNGVVTLDIGGINYAENVTLTVNVTAPDVDTIITSTAEITGTSTDPNATNNTFIEETLVRSQYYNFTVTLQDYYGDNPPCGSVVSTPAGIDCGATCDADFLEDSILNLTAIVSDNCEFEYWSDSDGSYSGEEFTTIVGDGSWARALFQWINADLSLSSEDQPDISMVSGIIDYHLTIANVGSHQAQDLVFVDTLPPEVVYVSSTTSSGGCVYNDTSHQVTCTVSSLWYNQQVDVVITVTAPVTTAILTNQATVSSSIHELDLTNNAVTEITTVTDQQHALNVSLTGDGSGAVDSDPAGIDCGSDCSEIYPEGTIVTLSAAPDRGTFFTGWSGDDCSGTDNCVIAADADKTINANFSTTSLATIALPKTGQTTCFDDIGSVIDCIGTGQDGELQIGMVWPDPRFELTYCNATGPCTDQSTDCDADPGTDTITDLLTGLEWSRSSYLASGRVTWQEALDTVAAINTTAGLGGYSDWRLPNINELTSLMLHQKGGEYAHSWLTDQGFIMNSWSSFWSSSTAAGDRTDHAWIFYNTRGTIDVSFKTNQSYVWAVRDKSDGQIPVLKTGQAFCFDTSGNSIACSGTGQDGDIQAGIYERPNPRFSVIYGDISGECPVQSTDCDSNESTDMVRDNLTGLILARDANLMGGSGNLQDARNYLATINSGSGLGGHTNWRLPNINELRSLVDITEFSPALIVGHPFIGIKVSSADYYYYWSSTSTDLTYCSGDTCANSAHVLSFTSGPTDVQLKSSPYYLWPVRSDTGTADLVLTMSDGSDPVQVNDSLIYAVNIFNNGPGDATDVSLVNNLPSEVVFDSVSSSQGSCSHSEGEVFCTMDDIASNGSSTVTIVVSVGAMPVIVENSATVSTSKKDPNFANNTAVETTRISDIDYTLTVNRSGNGAGSVTSTLPGIDCGSGCSYLYFETTSIVLTATADGSSLFTGWDGCDQVAGSECTVSMNRDRTVTAFFGTVTTADYYVASTGDDGNSGLGWSRPFQTITKALSVVESGEEIWVKTGNYQPPIVNQSLKTSNFTIEKKVSLYGGFDGSETVRDQRDWEVNKTTIDAQRSGYNSQSFFVDTGTDSGPGVHARIDGFVIRGGWALGNYPFDSGGGIIVKSGAPLIANCDIKFNYAITGGGIAAGYGTTIVNCKIHHNNAQNYGGGVQGNSGVQVVNSAVYSNYSTYSGGGIAFWSGGNIDSSTVTDNTTASGSEGIAGVHGYYLGTTTITNSIVWGNSKGGNPSEIGLGSNASATVSYSNVRGGYAGIGNIDNDPGFFDLSGGDLKVQPYAATIDTGSTTDLPNDSADLDEDGNTSEQLPWDLVKNTRVVSTVDMGAYEYIPGLYTDYTLTVTVTPSGIATVTGPGMSCETFCSTDYYADSQLILTTVPQSPYRFAYWEGCNSSSWDQCTVTMDAAKAITSHLVDEEEDADEDIMLDWWEWFYFHSLIRDGNGDYDGDGLLDKDEYAEGTNPDAFDSDGDGMPDGWEVSNNLLPLDDDADLDADSDGLTNLEEYELGTNPQLEDTDDDGMPDAWEVNFGLNPTEDDAGDDADGDGDTNREEYENSTNPVPLCGDVSDDTIIDLTDLIHALQVLSGISVNSNFNGDCNSDFRIGMVEAISILQIMSDD